MSMQVITALIYWVVVVVWLAVLTAVAVHYIRNPRIFGATRLLLLVVAIDTIRNLVENVYFGLLFGSQSGLFSSALAGSLRNPYLLVEPKLFNIVAGCLVLVLLLMRWLHHGDRRRPLQIDQRPLRSRRRRRCASGDCLSLPGEQTAARCARAHRLRGICHAAAGNRPPRRSPPNECARPFRTPREFCRTRICASP